MMKFGSHVNDKICWITDTPLSWIELVSVAEGTKKCTRNGSHYNGKIADTSCGLKKQFGVNDLFYGQLK